MSDKHYTIPTSAEAMLKFALDFSNHVMSDCRMFELQEAARNLDLELAQLRKAVAQVKATKDH